MPNHSQTPTLSCRLRLCALCLPSCYQFLLHYRPLHQITLRHPASAAGCASAPSVCPAAINFYFALQTLHQSTLRHPPSAAGCASAPSVCSAAISFYCITDLCIKSLLDTHTQLQAAPLRPLSAQRPQLPWQRRDVRDVRP